MNVFVEDIGRTGFSGLLAESEPTRPAVAAESIGSRAPVATTHGPVDPGRRAALASFKAWLEDQREALAS